MDAKHTPGPLFARYTHKPWLVTFPPVGESGFKVTGQYGHIANVVPVNSKEETESVARLIAAAPDLLSACERAVKLLRLAGANVDEAEPILAAIAKARA